MSKKQSQQLRKYLEEFEIKEDNVQHGLFNNAKLQHIQMNTRERDSITPNQSKFVNRKREQIRDLLRTLQVLEKTHSANLSRHQAESTERKTHFCTIKIPRQKDVREMMQKRNKMGTYSVISQKYPMYKIRPVSSQQLKRQKSETNELKIEGLRMRSDSHKILFNKSFKIKF